MNFELFYSSVPIVFGLTELAYVSMKNLSMKPYSKASRALTTRAGKGIPTSEA